MDMPMMVQISNRFQVEVDSVSVMPRQVRAPTVQVRGAHGTRNGR